MTERGGTRPGRRPGVPWRQSRALGDQGEDIACQHLTEQGYQILERNWRCEQGELDIVARQHGWLVFCEVKTRRSERFGSPIEAITQAKAERLRRLAMAWVDAHGGGGQIRIDVVGVLIQGPVTTVQHLKAVA